MIDFKKELNKEQLEVVENGDGYCLVLAGAGSGKTRTITYRVAYLLEKGVKPENILLLTFTNKASKEMIERVKKIMGGKVSADGKDIAASVWQGTFHAVANRLLRHFAKKLNYEPNFSVLDDDDSTTLLKSCVKLLHLDGSKKFPSVNLLKSIYSFSRNSSQPLVDVIDDKYENFSGAVESIKEVLALYEKRKKEANAMDFDDLLVNWFKLLEGDFNVIPAEAGIHGSPVKPGMTEKSEILKKIATQFHYVLIDEYQDTNRLQSAIVTLLASVHHNLLVVGDDAQSIYSFRAADINNILEFPKIFPKAKIFRLQINYRSTPDILELANNVIAKNKNQFKKDLKSFLPAQVKPQAVVVGDTGKEAEFIIKRILQLKEGGHKLQNIAVLFRAAFHAQMVEMLLAQSGIPYEMRGGLRFFERSHVKDALAFLRLVNNFRDETAWWRALEIFEGIGAETAKAIIKEAKGHESLTDFLNKDISKILSSKAQRGWQDFLSLARDLAILEKEPPRLIAVIADSVYADYLKDRFENPEDRLEDIKQLGYYARDQKNLNKFLSDISLDESFGKSKDDNRDRLILSTIHQSKGLEWEVVFLINLAEGCFPNERALNESGGEEEERRLFYVGITRAKHKLYLTYPIISSRMSMNNPSPFLQDIGENLVEKKMLDEYGASISLDDDLPVIQLEEENKNFKKPKNNNGKRDFLRSVEDL